jgi:hypothetical protein
MPRACLGRIHSFDVNKKGHQGQGHQHDPESGQTLDQAAKKGNHLQIKEFRHHL